MPAVIGASLRVSGDMVSDGEIRIDGIVEGDVTSKKLIIGEGGSVLGSVLADEAMIGGVVTGHVRARSVTLTSTANAVDISYEAVSVEPGAQLGGRLMPLTEEDKKTYTERTGNAVPSAENASPPEVKVVLATPLEEIKAPPQDEPDPKVKAAAGSKAEPSVVADDKPRSAGKSAADPAAAAKPAFSQDPNRQNPKIADSKMPPTGAAKPPAERRLMAPRAASARRFSGPGQSSRRVRMAAVAAVVLIAALGGSYLAWRDSPDPELLAANPAAEQAPAAEAESKTETAAAQPSEAEAAQRAEEEARAAALAEAEAKSKAEEEARIAAEAEAKSKAEEEARVAAAAEAERKAELARVTGASAIDEFKKGMSAARTGSYDEAIERLSPAIASGKLSPANLAAAYRNRGRAYNGKGRYDKAIADYTETIKLLPSDPVAYNNRGFAYNKKGLRNKAVADATKAIEIKPDYAYAYSNRCWAYQKLGQRNKAIADCRRALELNPGIGFAKKMLTGMGVTP